MQNAEAAILKVLSSSIQMDDKALSYSLKGQGINDSEKVAAMNNLIEANRVLVSVNEKGMPVYRF